ncbi:MAG: NfeD family protein [Candidatus Omnitrophica bacterium]|nr:NfeD family protein [Candidatus Omnitrophota bacterium]
MDFNSIMEILSHSQSNGIGLIFLGLILLSVELHIPGHMISGIAGLIAIVAGSNVLFQTTDPVLLHFRIYIFAFTVVAAVLLVIMLVLALKAKTAKVQGGREGLLNTSGEAKSDMPKGVKGKIYIHGELWNAIADTDIKMGDAVMVKNVDGLTLTVTKQ